MVEIGKAQKPLELFPGVGPLFANLHFLQVGSHFPNFKDEAQEGSGGKMKVTLFRFHVEAVLQETLQYFADVGFMFFQALGEDQDVVKVEENESL